jgi:hypothetical protein
MSIGNLLSEFGPIDAGAAKHSRAPTKASSTRRNVGAMRHTSGATSVALTVLISLAVTLLGCDKNEKTEITEAPGCPPTISGTGRVERVPDEKRPTSCLAVVLMCNYCEYKPDGIFNKASSTPCGACFGSDF